MQVEQEIIKPGVEALTHKATLVLIRSHKLEKSNWTPENTTSFLCFQMDQKIASGKSFQTFLSNLLLVKPAHHCNTPSTDADIAHFVPHQSKQQW